LESSATWVIESTRSTTGTGATIRNSAASTGAQISSRGRTSATMPTSAATSASQALRVRLTISARLTMPSALQATHGRSSQAVGPLPVARSRRSSRRAISTRSSSSRIPAKVM